ncbi:unnamed protein product [Phyllotreta striolata]|uniref:Secreted protein n=1 Tax=Phyllotreta striolata TaxID=444603 RepID=A0A9N9TJ31_PHYSR|nr:unnamed protein product [Phyllotreta striolata]
MISTKMYAKLLVIFSACIAISSTSIIHGWPQNQVYDVHGNIKHDQHHGNTQNCCLVRGCDINTLRCSTSVQCGHICSNGDYPKAEYGHTPGYRLKSTYTKNDCVFEECQLYRYTCSHCPDPSATDFNVNLVRKDCRECYQRDYYY